MMACTQLYQMENLASLPHQMDKSTSPSEAGASPTSLASANRYLTRNQCRKLG